MNPEDVPNIWTIALLGVTITKYDGTPLEYFNPMPRDVHALTLDEAVDRAVEALEDAQDVQVHEVEAVAFQGPDRLSWNLVDRGPWNGNG